MWISYQSKNVDCNEWRNGVANGIKRGESVLFSANEIFSDSNNRMINKDSLSDYTIGWNIWI